jgi:hypothetical protein
MAGFTYRLEHQDGTPADSPTLYTVVPTWRPGDTIPLGADRTLRVIATRDDDADQPPALVGRAGSPSMNGESRLLKCFPQRRTLALGLANWA